MSTAPLILLAGGTGDLGARIAKAILRQGAPVRALVRRGTPVEKLQWLRGLGAEVAEADYADPAAMAEACAGTACVVSALSGLHEAIVENQSALLEAAVRARVPRFIPSDFALDFTKLPPGANRNLDLRRDFHARLDRAPIAATSILNGAFADMLTDQAPIILFGLKRVLYWGSADQPMDFTTRDDVAAFTAAAALDQTTPRFLRIAGDQASARDLAAIAGQVTGTRFRTLRAGGLGFLRALTALARRLHPQKGEVYPAWQGMQYMENMFDGRAKLHPLDNNRYPGLRWTGLRQVLAAR